MCLMVLGYSIIAVPTGIVSVELAHAGRPSRVRRARHAVPKATTSTPSTASTAARISDACAAPTVSPSAERDAVNQRRPSCDSIRSCVRRRAGAAGPAAGGAGRGGHRRRSIYALRRRSPLAALAVHDQEDAEVRWTEGAVVVRVTPFLTARLAPDAELAPEATTLATLC
jgi:hypothetical protein